MEVLYHIRPYFVPEMAIECSSVHPPQKIPFKSVDRSPSFFFFWAFRLTTTSLSDLEKKSLRYGKSMKIAILKKIIILYPLVI
jgi:hypothetical protein